MSTSFSDFINKMDGKVTQKKIEKALEMLRTESPEKLKSKLSKVDMSEVLQKMDEYDSKKIQNMGLDLNNCKNTLTNEDIKKITEIMGNDGNKIVQKIKDILK